MEKENVTKIKSTYDGPCIYYVDIQKILKLTRKKVPKFKSFINLSHLTIDDY